MCGMSAMSAIHSPQVFPKHEGSRFGGTANPNVTTPLYINNMPNQICARSTPSLQCLPQVEKPHPPTYSIAHLSLKSMYPHRWHYPGGAQGSLLTDTTH
ncbi:hypothetical protein P691DRAFT_807113 [Macrolepiota fuliginosa MF-IS2]|uniref:Uncharacterized protein n=1 Tax=Macrolepiota fuliginosa MF-IS2 TaxID=1400762 RepID=A0A9P5WY64_9AGAR|nr:hypothetical protein P691DRAFT_807113 [Macrolepiota fuliginosa MF-IS2]